VIGTGPVACMGNKECIQNLFEKLPLKRPLRKPRHRVYNINENCCVVGGEEVNWFRTRSIIELLVEYFQVETSLLYIILAHVNIYFLYHWNSVCI
jgi:hypothetical protein